MYQREKSWNCPLRLVINAVLKAPLKGCALQLAREAARGTGTQKLSGAEGENGSRAAVEGTKDLWDFSGRRESSKLLFYTSLLKKIII